MKDAKLVWSDQDGDLRKKSQKSTQVRSAVSSSDLLIEVRRLSSGKGRVMIELRGLPSDKNWCKKLAQKFKKSLGVGGAYKESERGNYIEIHTADFEKVTKILESDQLRWKKTGG
jgi:translation initiation factor 1